ncbi:LysR family transcriptional regulator [Bifidobacterium sp. MA2]|uniref:LysR family transcriptional regulator n=1 Tax=Bifidobacterium santillanense TaxID=2809028 RepID=A0ABS5UNZ0_9BIFI|nr:LysR family transcriptional regulator [Bifidobacterium santillanense]MBT1172591.1 LysR family transcriptional regulator [Bifidobacterium santillanense]
MYDRRLDAIIAASECGSFNAAARRLHLSSTALAKQINGFEREHGLILFDRTRAGVSPTPAGRSLIDDARGIIRLSDRALRHARRLVQDANGTVRLAVSLLRPATPVLQLWPRAAAWLEARGEPVRLELVPMADESSAAGMPDGTSAPGVPAGGVPVDRADRTATDGFMAALDRLGEDVDVAASGFSPSSQRHPCNVLELGEYPLRMGVPLSNPLSSRPSSRPLHLTDLAGQRVHLPVEGDNDAMDRARALLRTVPGVTLIDMPRYTFDEFNACAASGDLVLARSFGTDIHPMIRLMPVDWDLTLAYGLFYPLDPTPAVSSFVEAVDAVRRR